MCMREPQRDKGRLDDMIEAASNVAQFVDGLSYEEFLSDKLHYFAILKNVEIIGEAAYMLSPDFKESHGEIRWSSIVKMRHILVHGYASVLPEILWQTAICDIPELKERLVGMLSSMKEGAD